MFQFGGLQQINIVVIWTAFLLFSFQIYVMHVVLKAVFRVGHCMRFEIVYILGFLVSRFPGKYKIELKNIAF